MTNPVARIWEHQDSEGRTMREVLTYCPGCKSSHPFTIDNGGQVRPDGSQRPVWEWDRDLDSPTFSPSMLVYSSVRVCDSKHEVRVCPDPDNCGQSSHKIMNYYEVDDEDQWTYGHETSIEDHNCSWGNCHSFLKNGIWQFLDDCAHELRGMVPMVPLPDFLMNRPF